MQISKGMIYLGAINKLIKLFLVRFFRFSLAKILMWKGCCCCCCCDENDEKLIFDDVNVSEISFFLIVNKQVHTSFCYEHRDKWNWDWGPMAWIFLCM